MKKSYILPIAIVVAGIGVFLASNMTKNAATPSANVVFAQEYKEYTPEVLEEEKTKGKNVAVFYHSSGCGSCRGLDASIKEEIAKLPSDFVVLKADWAKYEREANTHGITKYHTIRYYDQGQTRNQPGVYTMDELLEYAQLSKSAAAKEPEPKQAVANVAYAQEYKEYTPELLEEEKAKGKNVAVFYHSNGCGTCRGLDASIKEDIAKLPSDLVVLKADRAKYEKEANTHGVTKYHTIRYYDQGQARNKAGVYTMDDLLSNAQL